MPKLTITPISEYEPKIRDAYCRIKELGLLNTASVLCQEARDTDSAFLDVHELLPEADRALLSCYDENDCWMLVTLLLDYRVVEAGLPV